MVAAAGAGAFRAAIVVTARLRAVAALRTLTRVLLTSNNAFIRMGRGALISSGAVAIFIKAVQLLTNPVTGLLALLETGLATRRWLLYEQAVRSARVQLDLMGVQTADANRGLSEMTAILGRMAAREIFQAGLALRNLFDPRLGEDLRTSILETIQSVRHIGEIDPGLLGQALAGLKLGGDEAIEALAILEGMFPGIREEGDTLADVWEKANNRLKEIASQQNISNMERLSDVIVSIRNRIDPILGQFGDLLALIPLVGGLVVRAAIFWFLDRLREIKDSILGFINILGELGGAIVRTFFDVLLGRFDDIPKVWKRVWDEVSRRIPEIMRNILGLFTAGLDEVFAMAGRKVAEWISGSFSVVRTFFAETLPRLAREFFGQGLGSLGVIMFDFIRDVWSNFWDTEFIKKVREFIGTATSELFWFFTRTLPDIIVSIAQRIRDVLKDSLVNPMIGAINQVIDGINKLIQGINIVNPLRDIPFVPFVPFLQRGGIVPGPAGAPTLAMVHGGEEVIPVSGARRGLAQDEQPMIVNVFIGEEKLDTILVNRLTRMARRQGLSPRALAHL